MPRKVTSLEKYNQIIEAMIRIKMKELAQDEEWMIRNIMADLRMPTHPINKEINNA